ncbi:MAG: hypothetical protein GY842_13855 [bacterium]|nr:hypothetical protein [bacterium]
MTWQEWERLFNDAAARLDGCTTGDQVLTEVHRVADKVAGHLVAPVAGEVGVEKLRDQISRLVTAAIVRAVRPIAAGGSNGNRP